MTRVASASILKRAVGPAVILVFLTACGSRPAVNTAAAPVAPAAATSAPAANAAASSNAAASGSDKCSILSAADIKAATGEDVHLIPKGVAGASFDCDYATDNGQVYLGMDLDATKQAYTADAPDSGTYPMKESVSGLGDEATLYKSDAKGSLTDLTIWKGSHGVSIAPLGYPIRIDEDQLKKLGAAVAAKL